MSKIPNALLIVLHLHLLGFPLEDGAAAGYDERLFDARARGMRERAKALEDIAFFLVGRVEGARERAKAVRATLSRPGGHRHWQRGAGAVRPEWLTTRLGPADVPVRTAGRRGRVQDRTREVPRSAAGRDRAQDLRRCGPDGDERRRERKAACVGICIRERRGRGLVVERRRRAQVDSGRMLRRTVGPVARVRRSA